MSGKLNRPFFLAPAHHWASEILAGSGPQGAPPTAAKRRAARARATRRNGGGGRPVNERSE
jgi:hypothetical protein